VLVTDLAGNRSSMTVDAFPRRCRLAVDADPVVDSDLVALLDPFGLDGWFARRPALAKCAAAGRGARAVAHELWRIAETPPPTRADLALAGLRDLDFLLCALEHQGQLEGRASGRWRGIPDLEAMLLTLGQCADHIPRGCNHVRL
jgi:hypothetical protein